MWGGDILLDEKWNFLSDLNDEILEKGYDYIRYVKSGEENIFMIITKDVNGKRVTWKYNSSDKSLCEAAD